ncbi:MAG: sel1 repeat family protein [Candidatus Competibacteraceae bacterium]|nr:sel1 repeat family protein [Candidatus Competibacteraceae bacterium]
MRWFEQAANNSLPLAQYTMGMLYSNGRGVDQDWVKAYVWLSLAVSNGYVGATQPLEYVTSQLDDQDLIRARELVRGWQAAGPSASQSN